MILAGGNMGDYLMSTKEVERYEVFQRCQRSEISLRQAARLLKLGYRQTKRLWKIYRHQGKEGLISKRRGKTSPRAFPVHVKREILGIIREDYPDFGPTLIAEKLEEREAKHISKETIRCWMMKAGIWTPKQKKKTRIYQRRERRAAEGELLQADGSDHKWFEDRAPRCTLLVAVDDATGKVTARFEKEETTAGYFRLMKGYIAKHGVPEAMYTDRYSVFKVNQGDEESLTQFGRAMKELNIELIYARTPQAKGRVERANGTLQDRLVKELRLQNISTIEEANAFLPEFLAKYNQKFGKQPRSSFNAHCPLKQKENLQHILCEKRTRKLSKNLEVNFEGQIYQIQAHNQCNRMRGKWITIMRTLDGELLMEYEGKNLEYKTFKDVPAPLILDSKQLITYKEKRKWRPSAKHPWRRGISKSVATP
jgi:Integrase core domain/Helix-turn-helix domain